MHRRSPILAVVLVVASSAGLTQVAAAATPPQGRIGPDQVFAASVAGQLGVGAPAAIQMACFGPLRRGETGHPLAGQSVEVFRPEVVDTHDGFTGPAAHTISVFFGAPPPAPASAVGAVTFSRYGVSRKIPDSLVLPCSGSGTVSFVPFPSTPLGPARDAVVPVTYASQP